MTPPNMDELLAHAGWLRRLANQLVRGDAAADDLVQETWMAALERPRREGVPLGPWLAAVLRNRARQWGLSRSRRARREQEVSRPEAQPSVEELSARAEASRDLVAHVLELPEAQREVILLRHFEGLDTASIAGVVGVSQVAVRSRLARGHTCLRDRLTREAGGDSSAWMARLGVLQFTLPSLAPVSTPASAAVGGLLMTTTAKLALGAGLLALVGLAVFTINRGEVPMEPAVVLTDMAPAYDSGPLSSSMSLEPAGESQRGVEERGPEDRTAAVPEGAAIAGLVSDQESGHPVPFLELGIGPREDAGAKESGAGLERVRTDAEGRFLTKRRYSVGGMQATVLEEHDWFDLNMVTVGEAHDQPQVLLFNHRELGTDVELESNLGPAFYVDVELPKGAAIGGFQPQVFRATQRVGRLANGVTVVAPRTLVRFTPSQHELEDHDDLRFAFASEEWSGEVPIQWRKTWPLPELKITLEPASTVYLVVADDAGRGPDQVRMALIPGHVPQDQVHEHQPFWAATTGTGMILFIDGGSPPKEQGPVRLAAQMVPVGQYTAVAESDGFLPTTKWIEVVQGTQSIELTIGRNPLATASIRGTLRTESGEPPVGPWRVWLRRTDVPGNQSPRMGRIEQVPGPGPWVGRFEVTHLTEGEYHVWARSFNGDIAAPPVQPEQATFTTGAGEVDFLLRDGASTQRLEVEVVDAQTNQPIEGAHAALLLAELKEGVEPERASAGVVSFQLMESLRGSVVWVTAKGYGAVVAPVPETVDPDGVHRLRVALGDGWGALAAAIEMVDGKPELVAGATFVADGNVIATTDGEHMLGLEMAERPLRITVSAPGYVLESYQGPIAPDGRLEDVGANPLEETFVAVLRRE